MVLLISCVSNFDGEAYLAVDWPDDVVQIQVTGTIWDAYVPKQTTITRKQYYKVKEGSYSGIYKIEKPGTTVEKEFSFTITTEKGGKGFLIPGEKGNDVEYLLFFGWDRFMITRKLYDYKD